MIRAELDRTFMETKRNKLLWEVIATKMKEKGYNRSPEQCKCKWKNLVTRYKVRTYPNLFYFIKHFNRKKPNQNPSIYTDFYWVLIQFHYLENIIYFCIGM